jgi:hypothetical protein
VGFFFLKGGGADREGGKGKKLAQSVGCHVFVLCAVCAVCVYVCTGLFIRRFRQGTKANASEERRRPPISRL